MSKKFPFPIWLIAASCGGALALALVWGGYHAPANRGVLKKAASSPAAVAATPEEKVETVSAPTPAAEADILGLDDKMDTELLKATARRFAETDPKAGIAAATAFKDEHIRELYLTTLFAAWGKWDGRGAVEFITEAQPEDFGGIKPGPAMVAAATGWGETDPEAASDWLGEHLGNAKWRALSLNEALDAVLGSWSLTDARVAFAWLKARDGLESLEQHYSAVAHGWAVKDLQGALAAAQQFPKNSDARKGMLNGALTQWSQQSPAEAVKWFQANVDAGEILPLKETVKAMGLSLEGADPKSALAWASAMPDAGFRSEMMLSVVFPWLHEAPDAALQAVQTQLPDGDPVRAQVIAGTVKQWSQIDPNAAADWLGAQPAGPERDQSVAQYSDAVSAVEPQKAATWAVSIQDPSARQAALTQVVREWIQGAPEDCLEWCQAQASTLGPAFVEQVRQMIAQR